VCVCCAVETIKCNDFEFTCWDVGGKDKIRPLWRHYYQNTMGMVFVIDSTDYERMGGWAEGDGRQSAREEFLRQANEDELKGIPMLILANKQDLTIADKPSRNFKPAMAAAEIEKKWGLEHEKKILGPVRIQGCSAVLGKGLYEGFQWLSDIIQQVNEGKALSYDQEQEKKRAELLQHVLAGTSLSKDMAQLVLSFLSFGIAIEMPP